MLKLFRYPLLVFRRRSCRRLNKQLAASCRSREAFPLAYKGAIVPKALSIQASEHDPRPTFKVIVGRCDCADLHGAKVP